jgi:hypothetical protein
VTSRHVTIEGSTKRLCDDIQYPRDTVPLLLHTALDRFVLDVTPVQKLFALCLRGHSCTDTHYVQRQVHVAYKHRSPSNYNLDGCNLKVSEKKLILSYFDK